MIFLFKYRKTQNGTYARTFALFSCASIIASSFCPISIMRVDQVHFVVYFSVRKLIKSKKYQLVQFIHFNLFFCLLETTEHLCHKL